jgi:hypothetical protein
MTSIIGSIPKSSCNAKRTWFSYTIRAMQSCQGRSNKNKRGKHERARQTEENSEKREILNK